MVVAETNLSKLRRPTALPLSCINHVSRKCRDLKTCLNFYEGVLGFVQIKRPGQSLGCAGHWLFNYGIGIHLLPLPHNDQDVEDVRDGPKEKEISPQDDHISFQCEEIDEVEKKLQENGIKYKRFEVEEAGILIDQVFFHDPNGFMIEHLVITEFGINQRSIPIFTEEGHSGRSSAPSPPNGCRRRSGNL